LKQIVVMNGRRGCLRVYATPWRDHIGLTQSRGLGSWRWPHRPRSSLVAQLGVRLAATRSSGRLLARQGSEGLFPRRLGVPSRSSSAIGIAAGQSVIIARHLYSRLPELRKPASDADVACLASRKDREQIQWGIAPQGKYPFRPQGYGRRTRRVLRARAVDLPRHCASNKRLATTRISNQIPGVRISRPQDSPYAYGPLPSPKRAEGRTACAGTAPQAPPARELSCVLRCALGLIRRDKRDSRILRRMCIAL